ncbi:LysR substrate-binding domain-containing protein [Pigmentiphaga kullae]|uniref:LysR family glycine cleavage system transcriptional activator n=1 Tax=Pigmentiphaga kullae TaxID=151784 RepID=A0A4Q7NEI9_9BURK|nr:LysR substrate-binding domain-containing protein [Pigmentiphaga kullae]RZS81542.1 LysR family glycine cleavage system transcriptional activator [Pigmentiphaga kullae]
MPSFIPPLNALLAFEATARHLSFTKAANELHLTQAAISHQIRSLEDRLGTTLFVRAKGRISLTTPGSEYLEAISSLLVGLSTATDRVSQGGNEHTLSISCLPTFATECLLPLLPEFRAAFPQLRLQLSTTSVFDAFQINAYDVAIRYGSGKWDGVRCDWLCDEYFFPAVSPRLLAGKSWGDAREILAGTPWLRTYFTSLYEDDWPEWLAAAGLSKIQPPMELGMHMQLTSLAGAVEGLGVVIARTPLANRALRTGTLVSPFGPRLKSKSAYYLATPESRYEHQKVACFRSWLLARAAEHFRMEPEALTGHG